MSSENYAPKVLSPGFQPSNELEAVLKVLSPSAKKNLPALRFAMDKGAERGNISLQARVTCSNANVRCTSTSGGGCCPAGTVCGTSTNGCGNGNCCVMCYEGTHPCPAEANYGCCSDGRRCGTGSNGCPFDRCCSLSCSSGSYACADGSGCCPTATLCGTGSNGCPSDSCCEHDCPSNYYACDDGSGCCPTGFFCGTGANRCPSDMCCRWTCPSTHFMCADQSGCCRSGTICGAVGNSNCPDPLQCCLPPPPQISSSSCATGLRQCPGGGCCHADFICGLGMDVNNCPAGQCCPGEMNATATSAALRLETGCAEDHFSCPSASGGLCCPVGSVCGAGVDSNGCEYGRCCDATCPAGEALCGDGQGCCATGILCGLGEEVNGCPRGSCCDVQALESSSSKKSTSLACLSFLIAVILLHVTARV